MAEAVVVPEREHSARALEIGHLLSRAILPDQAGFDEALLREALVPLTRYASTSVKRSLRRISMTERHEEVLQAVLTRVVAGLKTCDPEIIQDPPALTNRVIQWIMSETHRNWRHLHRGSPRLVLGLSHITGRLRSDEDEDEDMNRQGRLAPLPGLRHDPREMLPRLVDFHRRWPMLSWPDRRLIQAWVYAGQNSSEVAREFGLSKQGANKRVKQALDRLNGELPCSQWDHGRCLASAFHQKSRDRIIVVMPVGAEEWVRDGVEISVCGQRGRARVVREAIRVSEFVGLSGSPMGQWMPAITSVRGVSMETLMETGGDVRISGPPFTIQPHAVAS